jgi:hypothetical protein
MATSTTSSSGMLMLIDMLSTSTSTMYWPFYRGSALKYEKQNHSCIPQINRKIIEWILQDKVGVTRKPIQDTSIGNILEPKSDFVSFPLWNAPAHINLSSQNVQAQACADIFHSSQ